MVGDAHVENEPITDFETFMINVLKNVGYKIFEKEIMYWGHERWDQANYNFTVTSAVLGAYGFIDGQAHAFPPKGFMKNCSLSIQATRIEFLNLTEHILERDLI
jgi:hypothetical protein